MTDEHTYVLDPNNEIEVERLLAQQRMLAQAVGPLAGVSHLAAGARVLDLACGPGGWVLDVAAERPDVQVLGVDISQTSLNHASTQARTLQLSNAAFSKMSIIEPFSFPENSFDLVNARLLIGVLRREAWKPFLAECMRVLRPGGILRLTEALDFCTTSSQALQRSVALINSLLEKTGYGLSLDERTIGTGHILPAMLRRAGYSDVHFVTFSLEGSANAPGSSDGYRDLELILLMSKVPLVRSGLISEEDSDQLSQQALSDLRSSAFWSMSTFLTVLGQKPLP